MSNRLKRIAVKVASFAMISVIAVGMILTFSSCGAQTSSTLEDIAAANPDLTKTIKQEITAPHGMTTDVSFSGDSFDITFRYEDEMDEDDQKVLVKAFDSNVGTLQKNCESAIENLQTQTKITGITGTIHIHNSDGKEIWSHAFPEQE